MKTILCTLATLLALTAPAMAGWSLSHVSNTIKINHKAERSAEKPLGDYLVVRQNFDRFMKYSSPSCGLSRYHADWEIKDQKLFLNKLSVECKVDKRTSVPLDQLFPNRSQPVFADWYSGTLRLRRGEEPEYISVSDGLTGSREVQVFFPIFMHIDIQNGVVIRQDQY
jgi:hypothetical protein